MTNRPSRNNSYLSYTSGFDEIYIDPSQEQSDPYFETLEGQQQQIEESHDKIFEEKYQHVNHKSHKHQSPTKNLPLNTQDSDINSLGYLTKQFMRLLRETKPNQCVDISEAARTLNVQKRRIYDITNVLQGIGYIEKVGKNLMRWVGGTRDQMEGQFQQIQGKIEEYQNKERHLNAQIEAMNRKIQQLSELQNYFTMSELYQLMEKFNCSHMIVYNGYNGIEISVSENTQSGKKQIMIESPPKSTKLGSVYVISKPKQQGKQVYVIPVISELCNDQQQKNYHKIKNSKDLSIQQNQISQEHSQNLQGSQNSMHSSLQNSDSKNEAEDLSLRQQKQSTLQFEQKKSKTQAPKMQKQPGLKSQSSKEGIKNCRQNQKIEQNKKTTKRNKSIKQKDSKKNSDQKLFCSPKDLIQLEKNNSLYFQSDSQNKIHRQIHDK